MFNMNKNTPSDNVIYTQNVYINSHNAYNNEHAAFLEKNNESLKIVNQKLIQKLKDQEKLHKEELHSQEQKYVKKIEDEKKGKIISFNNQALLQAKCNKLRRDIAFQDKMAQIQKDNEEHQNFIKRNIQESFNGRSPHEYIEEHAHNRKKDIYSVNHVQRKIRRLLSFNWKVSIWAFILLIFLEVLYLILYHYNHTL